MEFILFFFCFIAKRVLHIGWNFIENLLGFFWGKKFGNSAGAKLVREASGFRHFFIWRKFNGFKVDWILESAAFAG